MKHGRASIDSAHGSNKPGDVSITRRRSVACCLRRTSVAVLILVALTSACYELFPGTSRLQAQEREAPAPKLRGLPDWGTVEKRLTAEWGDGPLGRDAFLKSAVFRDLLESDNELLWNTMIAESEHPVVAVAGFLCINQKRPNAAVAAGLRVIVEAQQPASLLYGPIYQEFEARKTHSLDPSALEYVMLRGRTPKTIASALALVPTSTVVAWLRSERVGQAPAESVAIALDHVLSEGRKEGPTAEAADKLLEKLAQCPGHPRLIYTYHARASQPGYFDAVRAVLADTRLDDLLIAGLAVKRKDDIKERLDALLVGIPEKRSQMVRKAVGR
jgi:hypothetical protein